MTGTGFALAPWFLVAYIALALIAPSLTRLWGRNALIASAALPAATTRRADPAGPGRRRRVGHCELGADAVAGHRPAAGRAGDDHDVGHRRHRDAGAAVLCPILPAR